MAMTLLYCRVVQSIECIREVPACPRIKAIDSPASVGGNAQELVQEKKKIGRDFQLHSLSGDTLALSEVPEVPWGKVTESAFEMALGCHSGRSKNIQMYFQLSFVLSTYFQMQMHAIHLNVCVKK